MKVPSKKTVRRLANKIHARSIDDTGLRKKLIWKKTILYFLVVGNVITASSMKTWEE